MNVHQCATVLTVRGDLSKSLCRGVYIPVAAATLELLALREPDYTTTPEATTRQAFTT